MTNPDVQDQQEGPTQPPQQPSRPPELLDELTVVGSIVAPAPFIVDGIIDSIDQWTANTGWFEGVGFRGFVQSIGLEFGPRMEFPTIREKPSLSELVSPNVRSFMAGKIPLSALSQEEIANGILGYQYARAIAPTPVAGLYQDARINALLGLASPPGTFLDFQAELENPE